MLIKGKQTSEIQIEIDSLQQKGIVLKYIYNNFNWGEDFFIKENKQTKTPCVYNINYYGLRNSIEEVFLREASSEDMIIDSAVRAIKNKNL